MTKRDPDRAAGVGGAGRGDRGERFAATDPRIVTADETVDPDAITYPIFVKPARSGSSSFGVGKVSHKEDLADAVATARKYDAKVLIEEAVAGNEIGCAIMGDDRNLITGEADRIALSHGVFRIHQEDEPESGTENSVALGPFDIPAAARPRVQGTAKAVYRALECRGLS
jgi:D-alanine--(R)-lactate ligase